jgi:hypothetical protein
VKTKIKQANWKSKSIFPDEKYMNIVTTVYWQGDDAFIDTDSKLLFQMICENFFHKYKDAKLKMTLETDIGSMFPEAYRLYIYNLIYKELTGEKIKNDILKVKDSKELFYRSKLDAQLGKHQKRVLKIIKILEIDFKKESDRLSRILFNTRKKKDFHLSDKVFWKK